MCYKIRIRLWLFPFREVIRRCAYLRKDGNWLLSELIPFLCDISISYASIKHLARKLSQELKRKTQHLYRGKNSVNESPNWGAKREESLFKWTVCKPGACNPMRKPQVYSVEINGGPPFIKFPLWFPDWSIIKWGVQFCTAWLVQITLSWLVGCSWSNWSLCSHSLIGQYICKWVYSCTVPVGWGRSQPISWKIIPRTPLYGLTQQAGTQCKKLKVRSVTFPWNAVCERHLSTMAAGLYEFAPS